MIVAVEINRWLLLALINVFLLVADLFLLLLGLNLYVLNAIAPDVKLGTILWGSLPFALILLLGIVILCVFPGIATWLPEVLMG